MRECFQAAQQRQKQNRWQTDASGIRKGKAAWQYFQQCCFLAHPKPSHMHQQRAGKPCTCKHLHSLHSVPERSEFSHIDQTKTKMMASLPTPLHYSSEHDSSCATAAPVLPGEWCSAVTKEAEAVPTTFHLGGLWIVNIHLKGRPKKTGSRGPCSQDVGWGTCWPSLCQHSFPPSPGVSQLVHSGLWAWGYQLAITEWLDVRSPSFKMKSTPYQTAEGNLFL